MREFKKGDDLSHLLKISVSHDKDSDGDFRVAAVWPDGEEFMTLYLNERTLNAYQAAYDSTESIRMVTEGGIDSIEAFLGEG